MLVYADRPTKPGWLHVGNGRSMLYPALSLGRAIHKTVSRRCPASKRELRIRRRANGKENNVNHDFLRLHGDTHRPSENKMSDGGRERASEAALKPRLDSAF
jgi:hypothetical protein